MARLQLAPFWLSCPAEAADPSVDHWDIDDELADSELEDDGLVATALEDEVLYTGIEFSDDALVVDEAEDDELRDDCDADCDF